MPVHPQALALAEQLGSGLDITKNDLAEIRRTLDETSRLGPRPDVAVVKDLEIPGPAGPIPLRVYRPSERTDLPVLVYLHGGGWAICSLETHDVSCRQLANAADCVVVSVDYRLAPEHRFPAAPEDSYAALDWTARNAASLGGDPRRLAIGGDSAGGNLTAAVSLMARDRKGPQLCHQLLIYPVTDHAFDTDSYRENANAPILTREIMQGFWGHYLAREEDGRHPYASPLRAEDLSGLPPAHLITAEYDPLRDEGEAYARRLAAAGVPVVQRRYDGMIHGFFGFGDFIDLAREAVDDVARELRRGFDAARG
ncbi:MAG: alpha/beta hydrolase [Myxococcales bacterium]|nr:MAG: alpha/beta hydrolase [Myxococcales bacterium]